MTSWMLLTVAVVLQAGAQQVNPGAIQIIDTGKYFYYPRTNFINLGPQVGNILNAHYFPAMNYFKGGRYGQSIVDLDYFIDRVAYTDGNPNQAQYLSTAHYVRGMIYFYHAKGLGRMSLALSDFSDAIRW